MDSLSLQTKAIFILTEKCNMKCKYCYSSEYRLINDLDYEKAKIVVDFIFKNAIKKRLFFKKDANVKIYFHGGGEPTIRLDLIEYIVNYANELSNKYKIKVIYKIATNGILIDKCIELFKKNNFFVRVSLDTNNKSKSKRIYNNKSSFSIVENNIMLLEKYDIKYSISIVICDDDINDLYKLSRYCIKHFRNAVEVKFPLVSINSESLKNKINYTNVVKYFKQYMKVVEYYINKKYSSYKNFKTIGQFLEFNSNIKCENVLGKALVIHSNGDIIGCSELPLNDELKYGFVDNGVNLYFHNLSNYKLKLETKKSKCRVCNYLNYCIFNNLGCVNNREISEYDCKLLVKEYKKILKRN